MRYFRKIEGERIYLSPINTDDAEVYTKWLNDKAVSENLGSYGGVISLSSEIKALEKLSEGQHYAIILKDGDILIGNIGFSSINQRNRNAEVGLFIGEAEYRGKGYGTEALKLMVRYGFMYLNLHNILLKVYSDNLQGIACYKKAGFTEIGRRHECDYKNGHYVDDVYMEILEDDWKKTEGVFCD